MKHSHRILYAIFSLIKANKIVDQLRIPSTIKHRNQLIDSLQTMSSQPAAPQTGANTPASWPGLDLRYF